MLVKNPFHFIKHWYYTVWVDAIVFCKKKHNDIYIFPFLGLFLCVFMNCLSLSFILLIILNINIAPYTIGIGDLHLTQIKQINKLILFAIPFSIFYSINHLIIFRINNLNKLIKKYPHYNGKAFFIYTIFSSISILLIIGLIYFEVI